jgi:hypothetical protein
MLEVALTVFLGVLLVSAMSSILVLSYLLCVRFLREKNISYWKFFIGGPFALLFRRQGQPSNSDLKNDRLLKAACLCLLFSTALLALCYGLATNK